MEEDPLTTLRQGDAQAACGGLRNWHGCYSGQHTLWVDDAFAHPAKASPTLAFRILAHLEELGLLKPNDVVCDPMAGTGTFGLAWAAKGGKATLVELEPKFCGFIEQNKTQLEKSLGHQVEIEVVQGDARHLSDLLKERGLVSVVSPPYGDTEARDRSQEASWAAELDHPRGGLNISRGYGDTEGQIGALPDKPLVVITSPPYQDSRTVGKGQETNLWGEQKKGGYSDLAGYGDTEGQIAKLPDRPLKAVLSPPYEDSSDNHPNPEFHLGRKSIGKNNLYLQNREYGQTEGQIGQEQGPTYLSEMKRVYSELALVADVCVVVTKDPTRKGRLRELGKDTIALLEATGWRIVCVHHSIFFEEQEQAHLFEGSQKKVKGRLSFFKRLSYQKGSPVADHEDIIVAVRDNGGGGLKALTSPPYGDNADKGGGIDWVKANRPDRLQPSGARHNVDGLNPEGYGDTPGQIGALPDRPFKAILSPPFGDMNHPTNYLGKQKRESCQEYSDNPENIGNLLDVPLAGRKEDKE